MDITELGMTLRIEELQREAAIHGDYAQAALCEQALEGDEAAYAECVRVIRDAASLREES